MSEVDQTVPQESQAPAPQAATGPVDADALREQVIEVLRSVFDPEIPVNIYDLGLIYEVHAAEDGRVQVMMTLTSPSCPVAGSLPGEVEQKINALDLVSHAEVKLVWEPSWEMSKMSEAAKLQLNLM